MYLYMKIINRLVNTRWFKYDRDYLCVNKSQFVPVIFEPPCKFSLSQLSDGSDIWEICMFQCFMDQKSQRQLS
jgi:hypothetical protein